MQVIPISAIPNQQLSVILNDNQWNITLRDTNGTISVSLTKNSEVIVQNARAVAGMRILQSRYQEEGNFAIISNNQTVPDYTQFGITQFLVYITPDELLVPRTPPRDIIPASYFDPLGGLPLRFAPEGYILYDAIQNRAVNFTSNVNASFVGRSIRAGDATFSADTTLSADASAFTPASIGGLTQWLEADYGVLANASAAFNATVQTLNAGQALADPAAGDFHIAWWMYVNSAGTVPAFMVQGWDGSGGSNQFAVISDNLAMVDTSATLRSVTISAPTTGSWLFCELVYTATGNFQYYINNSLIASLAYQMSTTAGHFNIGSAGGRRVDANYDAVGVWARALTSPERAQLYNSGAGVSYLTLPTGLKTGLTSWYDMDEKTGNRADSHGSNTLTMSGTVGFAAGHTAAGEAPNNGAVVSWEDQSISGYDATQSTLSKLPTYVFAAQNGLPGIAFDSSNDVLAAIATNLSAPYTIFVACKPNNSNGYLFDGTSFDEGGLSFSGGNVRLSIASGHATAAYTQNTLAIFTAIADVSASSIQFNNATAGTGGAGGTLTSPWQAGGYEAGSLSMGGQMYVILVYDSALSGGNVTLVKNYINAKWNIY
jgi:hypothetical protein